MPNVRPLRLSASQLVAADNDNLVTLPDPSSGRLADLIASAGTPGQSYELNLGVRRPDRLQHRELGLV